MEEKTGGEGADVRPGRRNEKKDKENKGKDGGGEEPAERAGENLEKVWGGETRLYRTLPGTS